MFIAQRVDKDSASLERCHVWSGAHVAPPERRERLKNNCSSINMSLLRSEDQVCSGWILLKQEVIGLLHREREV
jgi:hypothetical protein